MKTESKKKISEELKAKYLKALARMIFDKPEGLAKLRQNLYRRIIAELHESAAYVPKK